MLRRFIKEQPSVLDEAIAVILTKMNTFDPTDSEYEKLLKQLERLMKLKAKERRNNISADKLAGIGGNLLIVLIIVAYEQKHVLASKGLGFVQKSNTSA